MAVLNLFPVSYAISVHDFCAWEEGVSEKYSVIISY